MLPRYRGHVRKRHLQGITAVSAEKPTLVPHEIVAQYMGTLPHAKELGIVAVHVVRGMGILRLPYSDKLVGNPENGVLHGGVVTTLIDTVCGLASLTAPPRPQPLATLDLRIDYLRPATPRMDLFARAQVTKMTRQVLFLTSLAYQDDLADPVASAVATFMFTGRPLLPNETIHERKR